MRPAQSNRVVPDPAASNIELEPSDLAGRILLRVFDTLDGASIRYCVLHGFEAYPARIHSDVDCIVDAAPHQILALLDRDRKRICADIVYSRGHYIVLAARDEDGTHAFLALDFARDCAFDDLALYAGKEILATRRRFRQFWVPAPAIAFGAHLARSIAKGTLDDERARRLTDLYGQDPLGADEQLRRFWSSQERSVLAAAASSGKWEPARNRLLSLRHQLRRWAVLQHPRLYLRNRLGAALGRLRALWRPRGMSVVLLGPDGAGKSSTIEALVARLAPAFPRQEIRGFAPSLGRLFGRRPISTAEPHGLPTRSFLTSVARAAYWVAFYMGGYISLHIALARSTLVLYDRHFIDILVDARRYRYGGPVWVLRFVWRVMPKPDLVILLDAPAQVLQARKQEVSFAETARQRDTYLVFVRSLPNGSVVDASQAREKVACDAAELILNHQSVRQREALPSEWFRTSL